MISVSHLVKRYGSRVAVNDVSFEVGRGDVVGFLGPNGAGKSTTLRILAGFLGLTEGKVAIAGYDVVTDSFEARKSVGYMPETAPLYPEMRVSEYLTFRAELKGVARSQRVSKVGLSMEKARVMDVANHLIGTLSKGYKQRVGLADALVASPPILILDEPTAGMDPNQIRDVRAVVKDLGESHTVLLSTHILSEVEATCSRVIVIAKGQVVGQGATHELGKMRRTSAAIVTVRGKLADAKCALAKVSGMGDVQESSRGRSDAKGVEGGVERGSDTTHSLRFAPDAKADVDRQELIEQAVAALVSAGLGVREVTAADGTLEDLFAELTAGSSESLDAGGETTRSEPAGDA